MKEANDYYKALIKLLDKLGTLKGYGNECECEDCHIIDHVHVGQWKEIHSYCMNCGGFVTDTD